MMGEDFFEDEDDGFGYADFMTSLDVHARTVNICLDSQAREDATLLEMVTPCFDLTGAECMDFSSILKQFRSVDIDMLMLGTPMMSPNAVKAYGKKRWLKSNIKLPLAISKALHGEAEYGEQEA